MKLYSIRKLKWERLFSEVTGSTMYRTKCGSLSVWTMYDDWMIMYDQSCQTWDCPSKAMIVASRRYYDQLRNSLVLHQRQEG